MRSTARKKLFRCHKLAVSATAAVAASLIGGLVVSSTLFVREHAAHQRAVAAEESESKLRQQAEAAQHNAEHARKRAEAQTYAADMNLAQQAIQPGNLGRALDLLNRYRPRSQTATFGNPPVPQIQTDLRGWEWRYLWQFCRCDASLSLCEERPRISRQRSR